MPVITTIQTFTATVADFATLVVARDAGIITFNTGIEPAYDNNATRITLLIEGQVVSTDRNAILFQNTGIDSGTHTLVVGESGIVRGNRDYVSAFFYGPDCLVQNFGQIGGGGGLWGEAWANGVIENHGTIAGQRFAGVRLFNGAANNDILNTGTITGNGGIELAAASATIVNLGDIFTNDAAVAAVNGAAASAGFLLRNSGRVVGLDDAVAGSAFNDRIVNTGSMEGDVLLGGGGDVFRGRDGGLAGELRGGDGNDTLLGGRTDDSIFGERGNDRLGGGGGDDVLEGGIGADVFVFARGGGDDTVADFADASDRLDLSAFRFAAFSAVNSRARDVAGGLTIDLVDLDGGSVFVQGLTKALFGATDVVL